MVAKAANLALQAAQAAALALLLLAGGCRSPGGPVLAPALPDTAQPVAASERGGLQPWSIDPQRSVVTIIVRRAGPLARLGHDHVITSAAERGSVWVGPTPAESSFELQLPVAGFAVDLADARARAGPEFAAPVPEEARAGTRRNLLRPEVLDAAAFPVITLRSVAASGDWPQPVVRVAVELRGVSREQQIPVSVERSPESLVVRGELRLNQSDYGITPFAVAGGAVQVADTLEIRFEIAAGP